MKLPVVFKAIVAMGQNRVIGKDNKIPWHLPEDFKWFKSKTLGHVVVMGRKTFDSLPKPLPGRDNVVLSRTAREISGATVITQLSELKPFLDAGKEIWVIGGCEVYRLMLPYCSDLYLTLVKQSPEGDVFFPEFESGFSLPERITENENFKILHYKRLMK